MRAHVPSIHIPDSVIDRMEKVDKPAAEGKRICIELIQQIRDIADVSGVHIMAYRREHLVAEIVREAGISATECRDAGNPLPAHVARIEFTRCACGPTGE